MKRRKKNNSEIEASVSKVIDDVIINKDSAIIKYTKRFDKIDLSSLGLFFQPDEIKESIGRIDLKDKEAIDLTIYRIR